jgi:hypothetical protein
MNSFDLYQLHNHTITRYLYIYVLVLLAVVILSFVWLRSGRESAFRKGLFYTVLVAGLILGGSGLAFTRKNIREVETFRVEYQKDGSSFLADRILAAQDYQAHFSNLLRIWSVTMVILILIAVIYRGRPVIAGICAGLLICCFSSLSLDYFGFRSDRQYFEQLQQLKQIAEPSNQH